MRGKKGGMILKVDLEKAFDRLEWSFIRATLNCFKFPPKIVSLIMFCVNTSSIEVIVNGRKTEAFLPSREIRQGDPISHYIFILCMERLSRIIDAQVNVGTWSPLKISRQEPAISDLFFADDLTLFATTDARNCNAIHDTLHWFHQFAGQKIN